MKGKNKLVPRLLGISKESVVRVDERTKEVRGLGQKHSELVLKMHIMWSLPQKFYPMNSD